MKDTTALNMIWFTLALIVIFTVAYRFTAKNNPEANQDKTAQIT